MALGAMRACAHWWGSCQKGCVHGWEPEAREAGLVSPLAREPGVSRKCAKPFSDADSCSEIYLNGCSDIDLNFTFES